MHVNKQLDSFIAAVRAARMARGGEANDSRQHVIACASWFSDRDLQGAAYLQPVLLEAQDRRGRGADGGQGRGLPSVSADLVPTLQHSRRAGDNAAQSHDR